MENQEVCDLLHRCAVEGREADWAELVRRYGPRLESRVRWRLHRCGMTVDDELTQEMLQEVYYRLLESRGRRLLACRGRSEGQVLSYLRRLTDRMVIDQVRHLQAVQRRHEQLAAEAETPSSVDGDLVDPTSSPEDELLARDRLQRLLARFLEVESGHYGRRNLRVLLLNAVGGWTSREISRAMAGDLGPSGVDSLLNRVKRRLRQCCPEPA